MSSARRPRPGQSYQRLEFLGDRVLGLAIAEMLYRALSRRRAKASCRAASPTSCARETCAEVAAGLGRRPCIRARRRRGAVGRAPQPADPRRRCEAMIGAVFLDGGYEAAQRSSSAPSARPADGAARAAARSPRPRCRNGRRAAACRRRPIAIVERRARPRARVPRSRSRSRARAGAAATGASKRAAEQAAARSLLLREGVWKRGHGRR